MAKVLDGKAVAKRVREGLKAEVARITQSLGRPPGLAVVLVGDDPASAIYVAGKEKAAAEVGVYSELVRLPASASQQSVMAEVDALNASETIDGFIVQMPLPRGIDTKAVLMRIDPDKDADGLHPYNLGRLAADLEGPKPCTPVGCMRLIEEAGVDLTGKRAVVIGRSEIVGKPMALLLLQKNATVTLCHSRTTDLASEVARADVVVAAVGRPEMVRGDWIKEGAVVIDVGINRLADKKVVGDVAFAEAEKRALAITPVPGGVGPMTIAMLLENAVRAAAKKAASR